MADAVTSQTLIDNGRNVVMKFTNISDGTGEAAVTKVDVSALVGAPSAVKIEKIVAATGGMAVNILWDATTDVTAFVVPSDCSEEFEFCDVGGLVNNAGTGVTGDIKFTTVGHTANDTYSIVLYMKKSG
jgi:hypothetical protein